MLADLHGAGVVFGAIEDVDLAVADDGGGVEGVEGLPVDGGFADGVVEEGGLVGGDDGGVGGAGEGADLPVWFGCAEADLHGAEFFRRCGRYASDLFKA